MPNRLPAPQTNQRGDATMYRRNVLLALIALATLSRLLGAQTSRGTVGGIVMDAQRAVIPKATVQLTALSTNVIHSTVSNEAGLYRFDAVDPGFYDLKFSQSGFQTLSAKEFEVGAAQVVTIDVILQIGGTSQTIEVTAEVPRMQVEAPTRAANIPASAIQNLPFASRNAVSLGLTAPGVTSSKFATPSSGRTFVVNGARGRSNNFMIDGTDNNDISVAGQAYLIRNPEAVQEVSVQTSNFDAEFGRAGGGVVNVITRSGTSDFHGSAGFVLDSTRDDAISSSLSQSPEIRARGKNFPGTEQHFDGTFGGPIIRDKTFFFASFLELRQFSQSSTEMVSPTAAGRNTLRTLFPAGRNANADLLLNITDANDGVFGAFNVPLGLGRPDVEFGRLIIPYSQRLRLRQWSIKGDHRLSERDSLSGRLFVSDDLEPTGGETLSFPSFNTSTTEVAHSAALNLTHVFSPSTTNELRLAYTRFDVSFPLDSLNPLGKTLPLIAIAGINTTSTSVYGIRSAYPQGRLFNDYILQNTISLVRGTHSLRLGLDLMNQRARQAAPIDERGTLSYGSSSVAGQTFSGLANFLDGFGGAGSASRTFGSPWYYPSLYRQAYFGQDRWRMTSHLTLNLGLRYEYFGTPMNVIRTPAYVGIFNVNPVTFESSFTLPNKVFPDKNNFGPMVGLAYSPSRRTGIVGRLLGERKTSVRLGYGIGYDSYFNNITSNAATGAPNTVAASNPSQVSAATPRGLPNFANLLPTTAPDITPLLSQVGVLQTLRNPYYQRWSVGLQRELGTDLMLDMSYVGSKGTRLFTTEDLNPLVPLNLQAAVPDSVPASRRAARLDPLSGSRQIRTNGGSSIYHSGQLEVKRRFRSGLSFSGAYTWSKLIDNASEIFSYGGTSTLQQASVPSPFGGLSIDRAVSFWDRPHRAVFTYYYDLPVMKSQQGAVGRFLGGWALSGITTFESGVPYTVLNGQDADGLGGANYDRPNFNPAGRKGVRAVPSSTSPTGYRNPDAGNLPIDPREARYIGISANTSPSTTPPGNLGRNTERAPGTKNFDVNIIKNIRMTEGVLLQFRTEFFNFFNTPQYGRVSESPFSPSQNLQSVAASVFNSQPGLFLNETAPDGGGRVIRWQLRLHF
jgi:outer membrane receptor protein involved in Fe transport